MRYIYFILTFLISTPIIAQVQPHKYFTNQTLRIDFTLSGNNSETSAAIFEFKKEPYWGGSPKTVDKFNYGEFRIIVKDSTLKNTLYTRGFSTLFEEWQTTDEAKVINKSFQQTVICPFPKSKISISIEKRDLNGQFHQLVSTIVNPNNYGIITSPPSNIATTKIVDNGSAADCVDIVFIADGYTKNEMNKFHEDIKRLSDFLFSQTPFNKLKTKFNIWAIDAISQDSGMTDPRKNKWKNTAVKSSFNTLNSDRYLESTHTFLIRDYAGLVPYDQIYVLANSDKYGGGGIYNHFSLTSVDDVKSFQVFVHEFGHSFAGLGDEYYTSSTSYNDYYNQKIEPWQPNLTTLVNFSSKWETMIEKTTPIPTPAKKKYYSKIGVFEGGGYVAKGMFRPAFNCRMKTNEAASFCPVCQKAINDMVEFLISK